MGEKKSATMIQNNGIVTNKVSHK